MTNPGNYNERFARQLTIQLGDLETFQFALAAADDYFLWLVEVRGQKHGAVDTPWSLVREARQLAYKLREQLSEKHPSPPEPEAESSVTRLPVAGSKLARISDLADDLIRELERQGLEKLQAVFKGKLLRIEPYTEPEKSSVSPLTVLQDDPSMPEGMCLCPHCGAIRTKEGCKLPDPSRCKFHASAQKPECGGCGFAHAPDYKDCVWLKNPY